MKSDFLASYGIPEIPDDVGKFSQKLPQLLVVDDFYDDPDGVRDLALAQSFHANINNHKGRRTKGKFLFPSQKETFERMLGVQIKGWLTHQYNGIFQYCTQDDQIVFHSDSQAYAAVIYLTPDAPVNSGTSFFKSKETGFRRQPTESDANRIGVSHHDLLAKTYKGKLLDPTGWELVDTVGNVYNRLVIWDSLLIHAASRYFGSDLNNSRLFHLFFFDVF